MEATLKSSLQRQVTFRLTAHASTPSSQLVALLAGPYRYAKPQTVQFKDGDNTPRTCITGFIYSDPSKLVNAGYTVDQVAAEMEAANTAHMYIGIAGSKRCDFDTFVQEIKEKGVKCSGIVIQNHKHTSGVWENDVFDGSIEIGQIQLGANGGKSFIDLQDFIKVDQYDRSKLLIDFSSDPLEFDANTYMAINCPANADFSIKFKLAD